MARQTTKSRIARNLVDRYGRLADEPSVRHGSEEVAKACRCEVCRRAFPDKKKRQRMNAKARKTNSCHQAKHGGCFGWKFAPGVKGTTGNTRGAAPCACLCHEDGRGRAIPTLDEYLAERAADEAEHQRIVAERSRAEAGDG